jgi:uncharacterized damage-inducible protein DinB
MRANHIRELYDYHISTNRRLWETSIMTLTDEQFLQPLDYSVGSIRNQCVHLMSIDERWFSGLRGVAVPDFLNPDLYSTRAEVRTYWDSVETDMQSYLSNLTDDHLTGMMNDIPTWAVLQHVVLHGMDHRAQMLAMLHGLGAPTFAQDFIYRFFKR